MSRDAGASLNPIVPGAADQVALARLDVALSHYGSRPLLADPDGAPLELSPALFRALREAAEILMRGDAVVISPVHRELSTTEAADLLNVSRQFLTRLIDRGDIPHRLIGRHRRIKLSDLLDYKARRSEQRRSLLRELTEEAAESGAYD
jgi:excisionase family DNA binding protein